MNYRLLYSAAVAVATIYSPAVFAQYATSAAPYGQLNPPPAAPGLASYETPPPVSVTTLLGPGEAKGPGYTVEPLADPTGMLYGFDVTTDLGPMKVHSLQMMRIRLVEFRAIDRLRRLSQEDLFLKGMGQQLENTAKATGKAIMNPIKTLKEMPVGFKKFAGEIQAQQTVGHVYGESGSGVYAQAKRDLARKLGVDPYTDNLPLQDLLNDVAKNHNRGQLVASLGTLVVGGGVGVAVNVADMNAEFQEIVRKKSAQQLQLDNRATLAQLGVPQAKADKFLTTVGYTATNCTAITRSMAVMGSVKGIADLLDVLPPFAGPESVLFAQTQVQMAAQFHSTVQPLVAVKYVRGTAVWQDRNGRYHIFSPLEYLYWNEEVDIGMSNIRQSIGVESLDLWISGSATQRAREQLAGRGVIVQENALNRLWK